MILSARFSQGPSEIKRYLLDYTAQLSTGETVTGITVTINNLTTPVQGSPAFVVNNMVIVPDGAHVVFFASGGANSNNYTATFLATTSIGQVFEDVVEFDIMEKNV